MTDNARGFVPRNKEEIRKRLQWAALELFRERGYEETTAAEIAAKAGVTERTFFRHFPDKREVLFDGEAAFCEALTTAVRDAPQALSPWDTLFVAFNSVKQMFVENRPFTEPRQHVIASSPALAGTCDRKNQIVDRRSGIGVVRTRPHTSAGKFGSADGNGYTQPWSGGVVQPGFD